MSPRNLVRCGITSNAEQASPVIPLRPATTAYGLVLALGLDSQQIASAGVSMTELADLLHEFACDIAPGANPVAAVTSSAAGDPAVAASDVIHCALRAAGQLADVAATADADRPTVGRLTVDDAAYQAKVDGQPVELTYREFRLLRYLAEHPHRVLDRRELLRHAWDRDEPGAGRTVDVHIARLRAKLGPAPGRISTIRGVGYRFEPAADVQRLAVVGRN